MISRSFHYLSAEPINFSTIVFLPVYYIGPLHIGHSWCLSFLILRSLFGFILRNLGAKIISFSPLIDALLAICVHTRNNSCWNCHQAEADTAVEFLGEFRIQCRLGLCSYCGLNLLYSFNALLQIS